MFRNCRLARMSDGHYCFVRDLGPVKGGKGMKHHEVMIDFDRRGMVRLFRHAFARLRRLRDRVHGAELTDLQGEPVVQIAPAVRS